MSSENLVEISKDKTEVVQIIRGFKVADEHLKILITGT